MSSILSQGNFVSDGNRKLLSIRSDVDYMFTYNFTQVSAQQTPGRAVKSYWQRGMADGTGISWQKTNAVDAINMINIPSNGFTLLDTSVQTLGAVTALTAISNTAPPAITTAATAGLADNDVVRISNVTGAQQLGGYDFTIDVVDGVTFEIAYMQAIIAATNGTFRTVSTDPKYYPRRRFISGITLGISTQIGMTVTNDFTVGQKVRFKIPSVFGTTQLDSRIGTITAISTDLPTNVNQITVDINSTGFTAFTFPLTAGVPFTPAQVIPVGEAAESPYENLLDDATRNTAILGMELGAGILAPAGSAADQIFWRAGKSEVVDNV